MLITRIIIPNNERYRIYYSIFGNSSANSAKPPTQYPPVGKYFFLQERIAAVDPKVRQYIRKQFTKRRF